MCLFSSFFLVLIVVLFSSSGILADSQGIEPDIEVRRVGWCTQESIKKRIANIETAANEGAYSILERVSTLEETLQRCNATVADYGYKEAYIAKLRKQGSRRAYQDILKRLETGNWAQGQQGLIAFGEASGQNPEAVKHIFSAITKRKKKSCSPVDLRSKLPPVRDQDSIGWCYAFVAADIASFELGKNISAADLATAKNEGMEEIRKDQASGFWAKIKGKKYTPNLDKESEKRGGFVGSALQFGNQKGYCTEEQFPSQDFANSKLKSEIVQLESLKAYTDSMTGFNEHIDAECRDFAENNILFPGLELNQLYKVLRTSSMQTVVRETANAACEPRINAKINFREENVKDMPLEKKLKMVHGFLDQEKLAGISYNSNVITGASGRGWHASSIVGRRWNEKKDLCELLVRNSWGTSCASYITGLDCEEGNVWVSEGMIMDSTYRIAYVKD